MKEGREVVLKTDLEIKKEAKRKSKIAGIVISVFFIIFAIIMVLTSETFKKAMIPVVITTLTMLLLVVILIIFIISNILPFAFEQSEYAKRSIAYTNAYLSADRTVEVKLNPYKNTNFMMGLQDIAKFYAIIREEDDLVEIYIKFNFEEEERKYEDVRKEFFYDYYSILEENK